MNTEWNLPASAGERFNDTRIINSEMFDKIRALGMPEVKENNQWLALHIKGDDTKAPGSWNAKVYRNKAEVFV